jgi:ABC-type multidrug transport system fused ATPase/permease subunit
MSGKTKSLLKKIIKYTKWIISRTKASFLPLLLLVAVGVISSLTSVLIALETKKLFDSAQYGHIDTLMISGLVIIGIVIVETLIESYFKVFATKVSVSLSNKLRNELFAKLSRAKWIDFSKYHTGDLLTRMTNDIETVVSGITMAVPSIIGLIFSLCASAVVLIIFDPYLALLAFILGPLSVILTKLFGSKLSEYHLRLQETESESRSFLQERLKNMQVVRAFRLESASSSLLSSLLDKKLNWIIRRSKITAVSSAFLTLSYWLGFLLAILWGSLQLSKGNATFGTITVYLQLVGKIQEPFVEMAYTVPQIIMMYASAGRLINLEDIEEETSSAEQPDWISAGISAKDLTFRYDNDKTVFDKVSFNIEPGQFTAVVGASGEGKTTVIRLLLSLLEPESGSLSFYNPETGEDVPSGTSTRSLISYVPQGNTLFSGTIAENVMLGNSDATPEKMTEALKKAYIWDFIESLPDKAETKIGENGYGLSEGQAQRIAIARALLCEKPVLILDEATSALDSTTELEVLKALASIKPRPTCIIITHRKAALDFCDKIITIKNGRITEESNL